MTPEKLEEITKSIPILSTDEIGIDLSDEDNIQDFYEEEFD